MIPTECTDINGYEGTMDNSPNTAFWVALLKDTDEERRQRLWNGYLRQHLPAKFLTEPDPDDKSWPTGRVESPTDGWPDLNDEETQILNQLAFQHGGHPVFPSHQYMDFREHTFQETVDFSDLTLVAACFDRAIFEDECVFDRARFFHHTSYREATFKKRSAFWATHFTEDVDFTGAKFGQGAQFVGVRFDGGALFTDAVFQMSTMFNDSVFSELYFTGSIRPLCLTAFNGATFMDRVSFREVQFGTKSAKNEPMRRVDFSGAVFGGATDFQKATFVGPPGFFETNLHRDTDFHEVTWLEPREPYSSYNIRAWEQLELMMSKLEKPRDRHRFFRMRMRALRGQQRPGLLATLSWLFELVADYGWGVQRAFTSWLIHWAVFGFILFVCVTPSMRHEDSAKVFAQSLATSFSNAHAFLGLTSGDGYLARHRSLVEAHAAPAIVQVVGTVQAVLGPILLFLLLLTLRNRFRLA